MPEGRTLWWLLAGGHFVGEKKTAIHHLLVFLQDFVREKMRVGGNAGHCCDYGVVLKSVPPGRTFPIGGNCYSDAAEADGDSNSDVIDAASLSQS